MNLNEMAMKIERRIGIERVEKQCGSCNGTGHKLSLTDKGSKIVVWYVACGVLLMILGSLINQNLIILLGAIMLIIVSICTSLNGD